MFLMDEPTKDQPESKPLKINDGASSLAYMPSAENDNAPEITMGKLDRDAEKQTMADIASELAENTDSKKSTVKVGVGSKANKTEKTTKLTPGIKPETDELPDFPSDDAMPDMSEPKLAHENPAPPQHGSKRGLLILLVFAIVAAAVFGWLWLSSKAKQDELTAQVNQLQSSSSQPSASPAALASSTLRLVPEMGLTYKLTDTSKTLTYRYRETTDTDKKIHKVITLSTTDVIEAERAVSNNAPKCTAEFAPLGTYTSYAAGDTYKGGKIEAQTPDNKTIFKIGDSYYVFEASQAPCSTDKTVEAKLVEGKANISETLKTFAEVQ